jgi:hypothetical protein
MQSFAVTLALVVAIVLIHFSYVDFRFRYRGGVRWFWLLKRAPPAMWLARSAIIIALVLALATPVVGLSKTLAASLGGLVVLHIIGLILLEVLEPR